MIEFPYRGLELRQCGGLLNWIPVGEGHIEVLMHVGVVTSILWMFMCWPRMMLQ